jgi:hypothetical protein
MGVTTEDSIRSARDYIYRNFVVRTQIMLTFVALTTTAVITAFSVEWAQRKCELWAALRDGNL